VRQDVVLTSQATPLDYLEYPNRRGMEHLTVGEDRIDLLIRRGYDFWVLRDPWFNEFCVFQVNFPEALARRIASP
jgi:hypothetical protein